MNKEFDILINKMDKNLEMRHTYLMFAFTTSMAALAILFVLDFATAIMSWGCLIPFSVIIPFQARISYSRLTHAKMEAYVVTFYEKKIPYLKIQLDELSGIGGKLITIIANYELTLLAIVIDIIYALINRYILSGTTLINFNSFFMLIGTCITFVLATYTFRYNNFLELYCERYEKIISQQKVT